MPRVSFVMPSPPSELALSIICSEISNLPMRYVYGTDPAGFGLPVVSAAFPGLPMLTNSMSNVLAPLPNVSASARSAQDIPTATARMDIQTKRRRHSSVRLPMPQSSSVLDSGIELATRNPTTTFSYAGSLKLRKDARKLNELKTSDPPRMPRHELSTAVSFHSDTLPPWSNVPYGLSDNSNSPATVRKYGLPIK